MDQGAIRRLTVLSVELTTARDWLAAELVTPTVADLAACTCRALRKVDGLCPLPRWITSPGGREWVYVSAVVSAARQLAVVLHQPDLGPGESRECVSLAVETLSLAARLGFSLARRAEIRRWVVAGLAWWLWQAALVCLLAFCLVWISR